ncbi:hypothetical protein B0H13DRAFT_1892630 [Mycena leptocephala]|nr:hypothetical protein B0H13DRAFT_1892630 [Mycena leptocephala]
MVFLKLKQNQVALGYENWQHHTECTTQSFKENDPEMGEISLFVRVVVRVASQPQIDPRSAASVRAGKDIRYRAAPPRHSDSLVTCTVRNFIESCDRAMLKRLGHLDILSPTSAMEALVSSPLYDISCRDPRVQLQNSSPSSYDSWVGPRRSSPQGACFWGPLLQPAHDACPNLEPGLQCFNGLSSIWTPERIEYETWYGPQSYGIQPSPSLQSQAADVLPPPADDFIPLTVGVPAVIWTGDIAVLALPYPYPLPCGFFPPCLLASSPATHTAHSIEYGMPSPKTRAGSLSASLPPSRPGSLQAVAEQKGTRYFRRKCINDQGPRVYGGSGATTVLTGGVMLGRGRERWSGW